RLWIDRDVIETDAGTGRVGQCDVAGSVARGDAASRIPPVGGRRDTELPPEGTREDLMAAKPGVGGDADNRVDARRQPRRRAFEPQSQHVLLRGLTDDSP